MQKRALCRRLVQKYLTTECDQLGKMEENLKFEQRAVIKFFTKRGKNARQIEEELRLVYGDTTPAYSTIAKWVAELKRGRESLNDDPRSGRPATAVTDENVAAIEKMVG
jgi:transposase